MPVRQARRRRCSEPSDLPFQPVQRIAVRMSLRDGGAGKALVPIVVVAIGAGEIELPLPLHEQFTTFGNERRELRISRRFRSPCRATVARSARSAPTGRGFRSASGVACCCSRAAQVDPLLEVDRARQRLVEGGIMRRDALHAGRSHHYGNRHRPCPPRRPCCSTISRRRAPTACRDSCVSSFCIAWVSGAMNW